MSRFLILPAALCLFCAPVCGESYGAWTRKAILEERAKFCDTVEKEIMERAERLKRETGEAFEVKFTFPAGDERDLKRFAERWKQEKITEDDVKGRWKDLMRIAGELSAREAAARPKWQEKMQAALSASGVAEKEGEIYRTKVKARKLGAVLDCSPSMSKYLPALRKEIAHTFEDYPNVEIWGSFLKNYPLYWFKPRIGDTAVDQSPLDTRWMSLSPGETADPFDPAWHVPQSMNCADDKLHLYSELGGRDNVSAMIGMVEMHKVDAIYWFCDLKDDVQNEAVQRLAKVLIDNKVKLYIHTVGRKPRGQLDELVKRTGGTIITEKPRIIPMEKPKTP